MRGGLDESEKELLSSDSLVFGDFEIERRDDGSFWELGPGAMGVTSCPRQDAAPPSRVKVAEVPGKAEGARAMRERFLRQGRAAAALRACQCASVFRFGAPSERIAVITRWSRGGRNPRDARYARRPPASRSSARNRD